MRILAFLLAAIAVAAPSAARAHGASSSYLTIAVDGSKLPVQWSIALRDLDYAIGLDADADGAVTWSEVRAHKKAIEAYVLPRLTLSADGSACAPGDVRVLADQRGDGGYAVLRFEAKCPAAIRRLTVAYKLLFDLDPMHRGLLNVVSGGVSHPAVLSPAAPSATIEAAGDLGATFGEFFRLGIGHIFSGLDHLLFMAMLLLPAMFRRGDEGWRPVARFRPAFMESVRILSAFTLAHAVTVTAASLGVIEVPAKLIEGAIALTIVVTAIDNILPILPGRRWQIAFGFGLIHGFGFASTLGPLSLPPLATATALVSFNLGVEAAQVLVACVVLPFGFALRDLRLYPARLLPGASAVAAVVALLWFADRAFGWKMGAF